MSEKRPLQWKGILLSLCLTLALYGGGILLLTLLTVRGVLGEEQLFLTLAIGAACASLIGGMMAGKRVGAAGSLLNAGLTVVVLLLLCLLNWEGPTGKGIILLGAVLLGGVLAALPNRGRKKRSGKRLVKSNKKKRTLKWAKRKENGVE